MVPVKQDTGSNQGRNGINTILINLNGLLSNKFKYLCKSSDIVNIRSNEIKKKSEIKKFKIQA